MRTFLIHTALFLLPLIILVAPGIYILYRSGEFTSLEQVERLQMNRSHTAIYQGTYSNFVYQIKRDMTIRTRPGILALGSSHVEQFRSLFFKNPDSFYNAAGAVGAMSDYGNFIGSLGDQRPSILIISNDIGQFDPTGPRDHLVRPNRFTSSASPGELITESLLRNQAWWRVYADFFQHKYTLGDITSSDPKITYIGLYAHALKSGYLNDGSSHDEGILTDTKMQQGVLQDIHTLAEGISETNAYEYGPGISPVAVNSLRLFLADCKERHIYVVGFIPPVPHEVYRKMQSFPNASYRISFTTLGQTLAGVYKEYGFAFFDFSDIESYGSNDQEMIDPGHGSEKTYARMMLYMAKQNQNIAEVTDTDGLKKALSNAKSNYQIFDITQ